MAERTADEVLADVLDEYQARLDAGESPPAGQQLHFPADLYRRIDRGRACIDLLVAVRNDELTERSIGSRTLLDTSMTRSDEAVPWIRTVGGYQILDVLGAGGFGIVYRALDPHTLRQVAIKIPRFEVLGSDELRARFAQEAQAAAKLDHPNIVSVLGAEFDGRLPYITSVYYPGITLADWLRRHPGPLPQKNVATLMAALADGVAHAHARSVLHRDLKPSNVLLVQSGNATSPGQLGEAIPKILDFGLAKILDAGDEMTRSGALMGTLRYMSPEQASGQSKHLTVASDVYGLGAILYELLAGAPPFANDPDLAVLQKIQSAVPSRIGSQRSHTSVDLETICFKCLEKDPRHRYASADELADDLRRFLAGEPIRARRARVPERMIKWCRRNPWWAAMLATVAVSLIVSLSFLAYSNMRVSTALWNERATRRQLQTQLYAVDLRAAGEALKHHDPAQAKAILETYATRPGEEDLREFAWHYLWNRLVDSRGILPRHPQDIYSFAFSPDESLIATACRDGVVRIWQTRTQQLEHEFACDSEVNEVKYSPDGRWLAAACQSGRVRVWNTDDWSEACHFNVGGMTTVDVLGGKDEVRAVAVQPDGRIIAAGLAERSPDMDFVVTRFDPNGLLDSTFGHRGLADCPNTEDAERAEAVLLQPDGKIVVAGRAGTENIDFCLFRLNPEGFLDSSFGDGGIVRTDLGSSEESLSAAILQPDGKIVATGASRNVVGDLDFVLIRYNTDGTLDESFGENGKLIHGTRNHDDISCAVALASDGCLIVAGLTFTELSPEQSDSIVVRYTPNGLLDESFGDRGVVVTPTAVQNDNGLPANDGFRSVALQNDGKIVVCGDAGNGHHADFCVVRYLSDGTLDPDFGRNGIVTTDFFDATEQAHQVLVLPDGKLLVAGWACREQDRDFAFCRYELDGAIDKTFGDNGRATVDFGLGAAEIMSAALQADGRVVAGGCACAGGNRGECQNLALVRMKPSGSLDTSLSYNGADGLEFSPDSQHLFACADQACHAWDLNEGRLSQTVLVPDSGDVDRFAISTDGMWLGIITRYSAFVWNLDDLSEPVYSEHSRPWPTSICFSPVTSQMAVGRQDGSIEFIDLVTNESIASSPSVTPGPVKILRNSPDGLLLAAASESVVSVQRADDGKCVATFDNPEGRVWNVEFTRNAHSLVTSDVDGTVVEWALPRDSYLPQAHGGYELYECHTGVTAMAVTLDGKRVACGDEDGTIRIVDVLTGDIVFEHSVTSVIRAIFFLQNEELLGVVRGDGVVETVRPEPKAHARSWFAGHSIAQATLSPNENQLALAFADEPTVDVVSWPNGRQRFQIEGARDVNMMAFSPNGTLLVVAKAAGLSIHNAMTGATIKAVGKLGEAYHEIAFVSDGRMLVAEGNRGVTVRNSEDGAVIERLQGFDQPVYHVATASNGRNFVTTASDVIVWDLLSLQPVLVHENLDPVIDAPAIQFAGDTSVLVGLLNKTLIADRILVWPVHSREVIPAEAH